MLTKKDYITFKLKAIELSYSEALDLFPKRDPIYELPGTAKEKPASCYGS
jgi:hypothetical protein